MNQEEKGNSDEREGSDKASTVRTASKRSRIYDYHQTDPLEHKQPTIVWAKYIGSAGGGGNIKPVHTYPIDFRCRRRAFCFPFQQRDLLREEQWHKQGQFWPMNKMKHIHKSTISFTYPKIRRNEKNIIRRVLNKNVHSCVEVLTRMSFWGTFNVSPDIGDYCRFRPMFFTLEIDREQFRSCCLFPRNQNDWKMCVCTVK